MIKSTYFSLEKQYTIISSYRSLRIASTERHVFLYYCQIYLEHPAPPCHGKDSKEMDVASLPLGTLPGTRTMLCAALLLRLILCSSCSIPCFDAASLPRTLNHEILKKVANCFRDFFFRTGMKQHKTNIFSGHS